jgi:23S rRNA pseudouridine2605 synthase
MTPRTGLARALSKLGWCSRSQATVLIREGKVTLNGRTCRDPEQPVHLGRDHITVAAQTIQQAPRYYLMLNKPRGLVTTAHDEHGRGTVFDCLRDAPLPHLSAVGRLDKASEGLLLFTNDTTWAAHITDPASHLPKTYHVQVSAKVDGPLLKKLASGVTDRGEDLHLSRVHLLREGEKNCWLEIVLEEGRNRHIRRVLEAHHLGVLRLIRIAIGPLALGTLAKGQWRELSRAEVQALAPVQGS